MSRNPLLAPRLYVEGPLAAGARIELPERAARHAVQVLRLRVGEAVVVFDGRGGEYSARLAAAARRGVTLELGEHTPIERESPLAVTLVQGLSSGERMDLTVQKSVELGVRAIQPVAAERSLARLSGERADARHAHWQRVAIAACEQCGRNRVPQVLPLLPLARYTAPAGALKLLLAPDAADSLRATAAGAREIVLAVGPEAGFDDAEARFLADAGFTRVRLGPRILRTETAAPAALAALNALAGDF
jgi:16S rRNA (uracil1498-N3)-methyltransferase